MTLSYDLLDARRLQITDPALASVYLVAGLNLMESERRFVDEAHALAKHLNERADQIEAQAWGTVNGRGEVQSQGSAVDAAAGALMASREVFKRIETAAFPDGVPS